MTALLNLVLGSVALGLGLSIFYGRPTGLAISGWLRERLRAALGAGLEIHDWAFAAAFFGLGVAALVAAVMWVGRSRYFWVMTL